MIKCTEHLNETLLDLELCTELGDIGNSTELDDIGNTTDMLSFKISGITYTTEA